MPEVVARIPVDIPHSAYVFPVLTSRKALGVLVFAISKAGEFGSDDLELMSSVSSHVAVALESALAFDAAEEYQRELARERDQLKLLLEINNHIVAKLDIHELFHSAAVRFASTSATISPVFSCLTGRPNRWSVRSSISLEAGDS